jgi:hypothetical protein
VYKNHFIGWAGRIEQRVFLGRWHDEPAEESQGSSAVSEQVVKVDQQGAVAFAATALDQRDCGMRSRHPRPSPAAHSAFAGFRFPPDVIVLAVRWYLRFGLSYRDVEELLAERGVEVDHVSIYRWVVRFTPLLPTPPSHAATPSGPMVCGQGLGKVRTCLVGDGRVSEGVGDAWCVGHEETGPLEGVQALGSSFASVPACLGVAGEAE